jgi:hypothetical protein
MNTLKILVVLFIMSGSRSGLMKAQIPQKMSYQSVIGNTVIGNTDTINSRGNIFGLHALTNKFPVLLDIKGKPDFTFITTNSSYFNFKDNITLFDDTFYNLTGQPNMPGFGKNDTLTGKWGILIWKPDFTTEGYYSHSTRTNKTTLFDNGWYRLAGNIFNMYTETKYRIPPFSRNR